jgi:hypothetical protein
MQAQNFSVMISQMIVKDSPVISRQLGVLTPILIPGEPGSPMELFPSPRMLTKDMKRPYVSSAKIWLEVLSNTATGIFSRPEIVEKLWPNRNELMKMSRLNTKQILLRMLQQLVILISLRTLTRIFVDLSNALLKQLTAVPITLRILPIPIS